MIDEAQQLASRLAAASEVFPIARQDDWDATARVTAENDVLTIVVREHMGKATREYRAVLQLVGETRTPPVDLGVSAPSGRRSDLTTHQESETPSW